MEAGSKGGAGLQYRGKTPERGTSAILMVSARWVRIRVCMNGMHWDSHRSEMVQLDSEVMGVLLV